MSGTNNQKSRELVRPGFLLGMVAVAGFLLVLAFIVPAPNGRRKAIMPQIFSNLRQIHGAKDKWAFDHAASNGVVVSESDLMRYLQTQPGSTGLVASVDGEVYTINAIGTPPEARLQRPLGGRFPKETLVRLNANGDYEVMLPNKNGGAKEWQPLSSAGNRVSPRGAPHHSP